MRGLYSNVEISNVSYTHPKNTKSFATTMSNESFMSNNSNSSDDDLSEEKFQKLTVYNFVNDDSEYMSAVSCGTAHYLH